ncbi:MAG: hypothetical protein GY701_09385 [Sulfitobacter sp.]|nr:hypothetical protein [Sulfitobacter sp.]
MHRAVRKGAHSGAPDRLHLHSLVYRCRARRLPQALGAPQLRNPLAGLMLMGMPLISVILMVLVSHSSALIWLSIAFVGGVYIVLYRKVALLPLFGRISKKLPSEIKV